MIIKLEEIDSTNNYLLKNSKKFEEETIVWAVNQTEGRGQQNTIWESQPNKNITMSYLLCPTFLEVEKQFYLTQTIALAIYDYLKTILKENISIKWPNDMYYKEKKIAGILIVNTINNKRINNSVIGIGININQEQFKSNAPNPISIKQITGKDYDIEDQIKKLKYFLTQRYKTLKNRTFRTIKKDYIKVLFRFKKQSIFYTNNEPFEGEIVDLDERGRLKIKKYNKYKYYEMKEIDFFKRK